MEDIYKLSANNEVLIGSKNPVKISATCNAFETVFSNKKFLCRGYNVPSGVSEQPMGNEETLLGAKNRVHALKQLRPDADFYVGIEGGLLDNEDMEVFAWMYIESASGMIGKSKTASFFLPKAVEKLIKQGMELGHADDIVFKRKNSKQQGGSVGILTHGIMNRQIYYEQALILALIPFMNITLFE